MNEQIKPPKKPSIDMESLARQVMNASECHINISPKIIITTEDKIHICLSNHLKQMERKRSWCTPLGILIAIVATFATSTFKSAFGLSSNTWLAIFIIAGAVTCVWLIWSIKAGLKSKEIEDIVDELKNT